jgi:hypothetical protein
MKRSQRFLLTAGSLTVLAAAGGLLRFHQKHLSTFGHNAPLGLHADMVQTQLSIGIPGIGKMYQAVLTNYGLLPERVLACEYTTDSSDEGTDLAYKIERWNAKSGAWETLINTNGPGFCKPYPTGIVKGRIAERWLWPGQSFSTATEATAARVGLAKADSVRFAVFLRSGETNSDALPTSAFQIDESPINATVPYRVRH